MKTPINNNLISTSIEKRNNFGFNQRKSPPLKAVDPIAFDLDEKRLANKTADLIVRIFEKFFTVLEKIKKIPKTFN